MFVSLFRRLQKEIEFWWFYKNFYKNFKFYTSENKEELDELFRLRYEVYSKEYKYIPLEKTADGKEIDEWDQYSFHFIIRDIENEIAATVRLITSSQLGFPIEKHFEFNVDTKSYSREKIVEISRFIVAKKYRRHHLMFVLIKGIYHLIKKKNIEYIYSVMDDRLFPLLQKIGVPFKKIGRPSLYQGYTYPCILSVVEFEEALQRTNPRLFKYLQNGSISYDDHQKKYTIS